MRTSIVVLLLVGATLAVPASSAAHARSTTVALDYRLQLDRATRSLRSVSVAILDVDRALRVAAKDATVIVRGELHARQRLGAPRDRAELHVAGAVARFEIPVTVDGLPATIGGTFVRYARPAVWPGLLGAGAFAAVVVALRLHRRVTLGLGSIAGLAALVSLIAFSAADAPTGRVAWVQIVLGVGLGAVATVALVRAREPRRTRLAGILGAVAAAVSLGSLDAFRHGVVVSLLSPTGSRALLALALVGGAAAAVTSLADGGRA